MTDAIPHHPPVSDLADRLARAQAATRASEVDALLISPGPDLRYLTGYDALPLERLTCLVLPAEGDPSVVVPGLETPAALAEPDRRAGARAVHAWAETDDPYALVASLVPGRGRVALDNHMWAEKVLRLRAAMPEVDQLLAGTVLRELRHAQDRRRGRGAAPRWCGDRSCARADAGSGCVPDAPSARSARTSPTRSSPRDT